MKVNGVGMTIFIGLMRSLLTKFNRLCLVAPPGDVHRFNKVYLDCRRAAGCAGGDVSDDPAAATRKGGGNIKVAH